VISTYAQAGNVGGSIGCNAGSGINNPTTGNPIVSRSPVDKRYNLPTNPNGNNISTLHAAGYSYTTAAALIPSGYSRILSGAECSANNVVYKSASLLINCPTGFTGTNVVFTGTTFVFTGNLQIAGGFVAFPNAQAIYVRGCNGCQSGYGIQVSSSGFLSVNSGVTGVDSTGSTTNYITPAQLSSYADGVANTIPSSGSGSAWPYESCLAQRNGPGGGGSVDNQTIHATFGGSFNVQTSEVNLCQTFVYLGANSPQYQKLSITTGGNCSQSLPCPYGGSNILQFNLNPGSKRPVQWTAPLHNLKGPDPSAPFDDITLWTEASGGATCSIAGQGAVAASGIFFMPNCNFSFGGQADSQNPVNAQFIARTLTMAGQGLLYLTPNPDQAIQVPHPGGPEIIR
jgi:hypothetical protein